MVYTPIDTPIKFGIACEILYLCSVFRRQVFFDRFAIPYLLYMPERTL